MEFKAVENRMAFKVYPMDKVEVKEDNFFRNVVRVIIAIGVVVFAVGHFVF